MGNQYTVKEGYKRKTIDDYMDPKIVQLYKELIVQIIGARNVRGFTQKDLAETSNVGASTLNRFETFQADINTSTLIKLLDSMNLKLVLMPKDVDMEMIRGANEMLMQYMRTMQGNLTK